MCGMKGTMALSVFCGAPVIVKKQGALDVGQGGTTSGFLLLSHCPAMPGTGSWVLGQDLCK